ncbi:uncharacterized protein N7477_005587 [Penicillium maclennaniae]|uniref:uncharacterized protein n=1 Tax=Penicillium maclennaniae TaxID=1343394 RepID=UPI00253FBFD8|nr:uncharacterized protein N7477_005587 [Penicillium maclennaniae]KAJ5670224.1 hypothetical protein N7477_005587 [Penicillium maclennaniae]
MPPKGARVGDVVASSATGMTFLILIQLASRVFTFASNQLILRSLSPIVLGIAAQLELYQVSILYFSRESIRLAIQRQPLPQAYTSERQESKRLKSASRDGQLEASQSVVNMSYLSLLLGVPSAIFFTLLYERLAPRQAQWIPFFKESVIVTGIASFLELSIEPCFAVVQQHMWYDKRAAVEMPAAFLKSLTTCSAFIYATRIGKDAGALPFALGYMAYSIALIFGYSVSLLWAADERRFSLLPVRIRSSNVSDYFLSRFSHRLTSIAASVSLQSLVKHLLTQGDSMMLAALSSLEDQGIYSLASNYGGLVARVIFQPLEESSRNLFSTLLSPNNSGKRDKQHVRLAKDHMVDLLRAYQLLAVLIFPLGPVMVPQVLRILGGRQWTSSHVGDLLSLYCYYIPFLAFNGITEAFVSSAANPREIRKQTAWMGVFSACYALAAYLFLELGSMGAYGLVLANIVNMIVRTLWSYNFIHAYLRRHGNDLLLGDVSIQPTSYVFGAVATATLASRVLSVSSLGIISAVSLSGAYCLLM